jgi:hypothetical protein
MSNENTSRLNFINTGLKNKKEEQPHPEKNQR